MLMLLPPLICGVWRAQAARGALGGLEDADEEDEDESTSEEEVGLWVGSKQGGSGQQGKS